MMKKVKSKIFPLPSHLVVLLYISYIAHPYFHDICLAIPCSQQLHTLNISVDMHGCQSTIKTKSNKFHNQCQRFKRHHVYNIETTFKSQSTVYWHKADPNFIHLSLSSTNQGWCIFVKIMICIYFIFPKQCCAGLPDEGWLEWSPCSDHLGNTNTNKQLVNCVLFCRKSNWIVSPNWFINLE